MRNYRNIPTNEQEILSEMADALFENIENDLTEEEIQGYLSGKTDPLCEDIELLPSAEELFSGKLEAFPGILPDVSSEGSDQELYYAMNRKNSEKRFDDESTEELDNQRQRILDEEKE